MIVDESVAQQQNKEEDVEMKFSENIDYSPSQFVKDFESNINSDFK